MRGRGYQGRSCLTARHSALACNHRQRGQLNPSGARGEGQGNEPGRAVPATPSIRTGPSGDRLESAREPRRYR